MPRVKEQGYEDTDSKELDAMKGYFRRIAEYPLLTPEEEMRLGNILCDRDPEEGIATLNATSCRDNVENDENLSIEA